MLALPPGRFGTACSRSAPSSGSVFDASKSPCPVPFPDFELVGPEFEREIEREMERAQEEVLRAQEEALRAQEEALRAREEILRMEEDRD